jgi:hypothetical protein
MYRSRDSSIVIARDSWLEARVRFPTVQDFSLLPASYPMGTGGDPSGMKQTGSEADHSPPSSAEVENGGAVPVLPDMSSWHSA